MKILLIGAGRSGLGIARLLTQEGCKFSLVNEQEFPEQKELSDQGIKVEIFEFSKLDTSKYDLIIKAPGVAGFPEAINELEVAAHLAPDYKLYAISGTNGKTTATQLFHSMLLKEDNKSLALGNIGYPMSQAIVDLGKEARNVALEISSFQMEGLKETQFEAYALMNLSPDHLDRYSSLEAYYEVKMKMLYKSRYKIINIDDKNIMDRLDNNLNYYSLSLKKDADIYVKEDKAYFNDIELFSISDLKVPGTHNLMNAMFASSLAHLAGVSYKNIQEALLEFHGVEHRLEFIRTLNNVHYFNDSKATNPESTEVCLKSFDQSVLLIAGGSDKKISFELLKEQKSKIKMLYLFGESAKLIKKVFPDAKIFDSMLEATKAAHEDAVSGDVVVLSPACASFDQFKDFEERGNIFKEYIKTL